MIQESGGGIAAVKQQQAAAKPQFQEPFHVKLRQVALIGGIGRDPAVVNRLIQRPVGYGPQRCRGVTP